MLSKSLQNASNVYPQKLAAEQKKRVRGSWKNKVTATEFVEERAKCDFDQKELAWSIFGPETMNIISDAMEDITKHKEIASCPEFYEMSPAERQTWWFKKLNYMWFKMPEKREHYFNPSKSLRMTWWWVHKG